jgi:sialidase-1
MFRQIELFEAGTGGYHTYRIPALVVSRQGTMLAVCEGRKYGRGDAGKIDLLLRRSDDGGRTWGPAQLIVEEDDSTCGNPCPVVDQRDGTIWLPFCKNLGEGHQGLIMQDKAPRTVWITSSHDDGATWSEPQEITESVKPLGWTWYSTGPTHGIQLASGRLLIPCCHSVGVTFTQEDPYYSHVIFSDDHGQSWLLGGRADGGTDECGVVEVAGGAVYLNARSPHTGKRRSYAWSYDEGASFTDIAFEPTLVEPDCQASLVRLSWAGPHDRNRILFANPRSTEREAMTLHISYDEGQSWEVGKTLYPGPSAYSDLCIAPDMTICCLYERGNAHPYEKLTLAQLDLEWLTDGRDQMGGQA